MANEYWRQREEQALAEYQLTDDEYVRQLNDIYDYMVDQINREVRGFYSKYADAEGITMAEAAKRASELDMDEYSRKAKKYVAEKDFSAQANREMRLYNMTMKVNRLELLKSNIGLEMVNGFQDIEDLFGDSLTERAMDEFRRQAGILGNTVHDVARDADSIVSASFHNANWSDRIWMYQGMLRDELSTLLQQGMIQGRNPNELARHINNLFDAGKYNCERLMRTEMTRVQSDAQLQSFIANGFDEYQFNALGNACPDCKALDEQHFKIMDAEPGVNLPPIHPNCRCAVSAWMDDANYDEWLDSYPDHGMSYEDWLENRPTAVEGGKLEFAEAKSIKEAEEFARACGVDDVSYKGIDLEVANAMNQSLVDAFNYCPELREKLKCYGSAQEINKAYKDALIPCLQKRYRETYLRMGYSEGDAATKANEIAKAYASTYVGKVSGKTYAFARSGHPMNASGELLEIAEAHRCVAVNQKWGKSGSELSTSVANDIESGWHPEGTSSIKAIFDHEFGHQLDFTYDLSDWGEMRTLYYGHSSEEVAEGLSRYATESIAEFIAEGYTEYINNPTPREMAVEIGRLIEKKVSET